MCYNQMGLIYKLKIFFYKIIDRQKYRLSICNVCPSNQYSVCVECACPIHTKTMMKNVTCPLNKW
jgi:hypothetical protein